MEINRCRQRAGCGNPPCGRHAVGKPTHQIGDQGGILVVGEAPAADGWWRTGRAFYREASSGRLELSRTGVNLNRCLAVLGSTIDRVGFVEAVKCRPSSAAWRPGERVRQQVPPFLTRSLTRDEAQPCAAARADRVGVVPGSDARNGDRAPRRCRRFGPGVASAVGMLLGAAALSSLSGQRRAVAQKHAVSPGVCGSAPWHNTAEGRPRKKRLKAEEQAQEEPKKKRKERS